MNDLISRQAAIDALWKALYEYEDKTEKQFIESNELDVEDWVQHRIFVQNMNDIDRQTIFDLPSAQQWIPCSERLPEKTGFYLCTVNKTYPNVKVAKFEEHVGGGYGWVLVNGAELLPKFVLAWMPLPQPWRGEQK